MAVVQTVLILFMFAVTFAATAGVTFLRLRGQEIAACVAAAPLTGVMLVLGIAALEGNSGFSALWAACAYALGWAVAFLMADRYMGLMLSGVSGGRAIREICRADAPALAAIAIMAVLVPCMVASSSTGAFRTVAFFVAAANGAGLVSGFVGVWPPLVLLAHDEDFIARANRVRESWTRVLDRLAPMTEPRWSSSAAGVLAVFVVMAAFGAGSLDISQAVFGAGARATAGGAAILLICAYILGRDWRRAVAIFILAATCMLFAAWGFGRSGVSVDGSTALLTADALVAAFLPIAAIAAGVMRGTGDNQALIYFEAVIARGPAALTAAGGMLCVLLVWSGATEGGFLGLAMALIFAAASAIIFVPALVHVIEIALPRRRALADRYRAH
jgi:hypothetical protein